MSHTPKKKTRRRFEPNVRRVVYTSEITGEKYKLKVVAKTMRTIEKLGGLDAFLLNTKSSTMSLRAKKLKKEIAKKVNGAVE